MARRKSDLARLEGLIDHSFSDRALLERALTHVSALPGTPAHGPHYQRLEFLGDRVLGLAISELLYRSFPDASEGDLSRRLGHLVRRETCAEVARGWNVSDFLRLGAGEAQSGLRQKEAILADVCEAIIAAVYLDAGYAAAAGLVERAFGPKISEPRRATRDPKTQLQEWALGQALPLPAYELAGRSGPDHAPRFTVTVSLHGFAPCEGEGGNKRAAEMAAAEAFLRREGVSVEAAA